ncbi:MAG: hypothetical protein NTV30_08780 [Chloroflexi bacterium]|nr:hypothetical protein [Chloroflexota bacterium]
MRKRRLTKLGIIAAITIVAIWSISTSIHIGSLQRDGWRLGLDLKGGTQLIYEADTTGVPDVAGAMKFARDIIESRINAYGVNEPQIQIQGSNRITVQLAGITNIEEALKLIGQTANLDFRKLAESAADGLTSISGSANKGDLSIKVADTSNLKVGYAIRIGNEEKVISAINSEEKKITLTESLGNAYTNGTAVTQWIPATGDNQRTSSSVNR